MPLFSSPGLTLACYSASSRLPEVIFRSQYLVCAVTSHVLVSLNPVSKSGLCKCPVKCRTGGTDSS